MNPPALMGREEVGAFRAAERARSILIVTPTPERGMVVAWVRDAYGPAALDEVQALSFDELRSGMLGPGTEPLQGGAPERLAA